tara:strand:+ start:3196 stop:3900 length:705 start_codon:yes stop_codon:yes gene_type:complete
MNSKNKFYLNRTVKKPWGYEYVIYNDSSKIAVTFIYIKNGHKTSLHCHPSKKTAFIVLDGKASVQIGIYKENKRIYKSLSRLVLRPGLFHCLEAVSKKGLYALEFETPYDKNDLLRFKDKYGRKSKNYEGLQHTKKNLNKDLVKFKKPKVGKKNLYELNKTKVSIEAIKNFKEKINRNDSSTSAILDGSIVNDKGQKVISHGEVVKTKTLEIFCKNFKIKNKLVILKVSKNKSR